MDWRCIGISYAPPTEQTPRKTSHGDIHTSSAYPFDTPSDNAKPPKYQRWQYIVGVNPEDQAYYLHLLEGSANTGNVINTKPLSIVDKEAPLPRYYSESIDADYPNETLKKRTEAYKQPTLDHSVTPSLDTWLNYIAVKSRELVANFQRNALGLPESLLARISYKQELEVATQSCELLSKLSYIVQKTSSVHWRDTKTNAGIAYMFVIILFYKGVIIPEFDHVLDTVKWIKTWSNDYLRINDIEHNLSVEVHRAVSLEPVFWEYMTGVLLQSKMTHARFLKVTQFFLKHLTESLDDTNRDTVENSIIILLTECILPRLLLSGHYDIAVNIIRQWLGYNIFGSIGRPHFGIMSRHYLLYDLLSVNKECPVDRGLLLDLCELVDEMLMTREGNTELGYLGPLDYCNVNPVDTVPFIPVPLSNSNITSLLLRILDLLGSQSIDRCSSESKWYNFVNAIVIKTQCSLNLQTLLLLHVFIARPKSMLISHLLMLACGSKEVAKLLLALHVNRADLWATYCFMGLDTDEAYRDSIEVFPCHYPLLVAYTTFCLERGIPTKQAIEYIVDSLDKKATKSSETLGSIIPSKDCALVLLWTLNNADYLTMRGYMRQWKLKVSKLREQDLVHVLKAVCLMPGLKMGHKMAEYIIGLYSNNEKLCTIYVKYCIGRANRPAIRRMLSREMVLSQLSMATRHIEQIVNYSLGGRVYTASVRLMLLSRMDTCQTPVHLILHEPMPFQLPHVRLLVYILENTPRGCDALDLVVKHAGFAKVLWLILFKHLLASSDIVKEDMEMHGINT
ncbi:hypothetical protein BBOV_I002920 [Babesia bovis T2Bo]|uniref:Uncharacterized protein n=1 Tax=Babesia bovis TaxID=5865 RepID=A7AWE6_BABBO|nr:hypothetical protein BBOV_I002920 [Babesia bovis T2Bo]EDO05374.1 hypothetical protein BBOV_I002920 [Babesia bovis T2Bo]|eukprot:XP_001608942.1 hypothetical protein [Babesia bovis T2Bo]